MGSDPNTMDALAAAANGKPLLYFDGARGDDRSKPPIAGVLSRGSGKRRASALIAALTGDGEEHRTVLADSPNLALRQARRAAAALGERLTVLRLHANEPLARYARWDELSEFPPPGINPQMIYKLRASLDRGGHQHVRIAVSGTFDADRIRRFEGVHAPVDAYCVESALVSEEDRGAAA